MAEVKSIVLVPAVLVVVAISVITGCSRGTEEVAQGRYADPDRLFEQVFANVRANSSAEVIADIDHSRLAAQAGSSMPPSHLLIWSEPEVEAAIIAKNQLAAIDLPLRVLAFENQDTGTAAVTFNSYDYLAQRYSLEDDTRARSLYDAAFARALKGIPDSAITRFPSDTMADPGLVTLLSPYDFSATKQRVLEAITAEPDTLVFGTVDFAARSKRFGVDLEPTDLILFGSPGPGGKAMAAAPTLGLDAFPQKLLVWQDTDGTVRLTFNDLTAIAKRQEVSGGIPLRMINHRIRKTFEAALN